MHSFSEKQEAKIFVSFWFMLTYYLQHLSFDLLAMSLGGTYTRITGVCLTSMGHKNY